GTLVSMQAARSIWSSAFRPPDNRSVLPGMPTTLKVEFRRCFSNDILNVPFLDPHFLPVQYHLKGHCLRFNRMSAIPKEKWQTKLGTLRCNTLCCLLHLHPSFLF